jgi:predicted nucleic acid-binding protein
MKTHGLLDAGPLVAAIDRRDRYHDWAKARLDAMELPLLSCEAVLTEACHLLRRLQGGSQGVLELVNRGIVRLPFALQKEAATVAHLLERYASVPMSLADACLVRMSELVAGSAVVTVDSDFHIYRRNGRQVIPTIMPESPGR